ncbi:MAG TPA: helix-turn-helix domain-containing protein [Ktedonobacteraceae bacterium]|jgi:AcrR family transcriptional regulator
MARLADPNRREDILRAAREVFLASGYSEARLSDIAKRAGVVVSTLYLYFASKEEMVQEMARGIYIEVARAILPVLKELKDKDDIRRFVRIVLSLAERNSDMVRCFLLDVGLRSVGVKRGEQTRGPFFYEIQQVLTQRMERGYIRRYDPTILVEILVGFQRWIFETYVLSEEDELPRYEEMLVEWLANALLPEASLYPGEPL